jgi:hypothetical protein
MKGSRTSKLKNIYDWSGNCVFTCTTYERAVIDENERGYTTTGYSIPVLDTIFTRFVNYVIYFGGEVYSFHGLVAHRAALLVVRLPRNAMQRSLISIDLIIVLQAVHRIFATTTAVTGDVQSTELSESYVN